MTSTPLRVGVYLRVSLDNTGEELAITRQRKECLRIAADRGWTVVGEFCDNSISASSPRKRRPGYDALVKAYQDGEIQGIICWDLDRLTRQVRQLEDWIDRAEEQGLVLVTANGEADLTTDGGRMFARIKVTVARGEVERKAARHRAAARQKAELGKRSWVNRPFGYLRDGTPHPVEAPLVVAAYKDVIAGQTLSGVAREWNAAGHLGTNGSTWKVATVRQLLSSPRNAGLRSYTTPVKGKGKPGSSRGPGTKTEIVGEASNWTALVDEKTWRAALAAFARNADGRCREPRTYLLTGVARCGRCGHHMNGATCGPLPRYRCQASSGGCGNVSLAGRALEEIILTLLTQRLSRPDAVDMLADETHDEAEAERLRLEHNVLRARLDEVAMLLADGEMDARSFKVARDRVLEKIQAVEAQMHSAQRLRLFDEIPLGTPEVGAKLGRLSPNRLRSIIDLLMTVTVKPAGERSKVRGTINPERIQVEWK